MKAVLDTFAVADVLSWSSLREPPGVALYPLGCDVFDCDSHELRPAFIGSDAMGNMEKEPRWMRGDLAKYGPDILSDPGVVFGGLNRPGLNGVEYCCYCGVVANSPQAGIFLIFVREPEGFALTGPIVFWVEWREEDPDKPGFPLGWKSDFGGVKCERKNRI